MWIAAVEGSRKMKPENPSFMCGLRGGLGGLELRAERPRGARSVAAAPLGASSENWQACGGQGWFVKSPRRRPFQELRDAVDLVVVSAVRKAE